MLTIDVVLHERLGEGVQDGIAAHAVVQRPVGVVLETAEHLGLLFTVKGVYNFIRVAHEAVDVVNGLTERRRQKADAKRKARAVRFGRSPRTFRSHIVVEFQGVHDSVLTLKGGFMFNSEVHSVRFLGQDAVSVQVASGFSRSHFA